MTKTYIVSGYLTIGVVKEIEASSESEARTKAGALGVPGLCHQCSGAGGTGEWELNGFDDPPDDCVQHVEVCDE
jgi:hypothetical protein